MGDDADYREVVEIESWPDVFHDWPTFIEHTYVPSRMSAYSLAKALVYVGVQRPDIFKNFFMGRFSDFLGRVFDSLDLREKKPTKQQKDEHKRQRGVFEAVIFNNLEGILEECLEPVKNPREFRGDNIEEDFDKFCRDCSTFACFHVRQSDGDSFSYIKRPADYDERETNRYIFNLRFQRQITRLLKADWFRRICVDYDTVQKVKECPERFVELEEKCRGVLSWFMRERLPYIDEGDWHQEGLLTIWRCMNGYEGRNFVSFKSYVKKALKNRRVDLIRFYSADKRRIIKITKPLGSGSNPEDSILAARLDDLVYHVWAGSGKNGKLLSGSSLKRRWENFGCNGEAERKAVFSDSWEEADSGNFPYDKERRILIESDEKV